MKIVAYVYFSIFELYIIFLLTKDHLLCYFFASNWSNHTFFYICYWLKLSSSVVCAAPCAICFPLVFRIQDKLCWHIAFYKTKWWYWVYVVFCGIPKFQIQIFGSRHLGYVRTLTLLKNINFDKWSKFKIKVLWYIVLY